MSCLKFISCDFDLSGLFFSLIFIVFSFFVHCLNDAAQHFMDSIRTQIAQMSVPYPPSFRELLPKAEHIHRNISEKISLFIRHFAADDGD